MVEPFYIEPVPPAGRRAALRFLLGGEGDDYIAASRAEGLVRHLRTRPQPEELWWARAGQQCAAVALTIHNPGRVGLLLFSRPGQGGVDETALAAAMQAAAQQSIRSGSSFVQVMVEDDRDADRAVVQAAGFELLARLVHLRQSPPRGGGAEPADLRWRTAEQFASQELARVIEATYVASLDCPPLSGARRIEDVLEGHRAAGVYRPSSWWILDAGSAPAGCVLMNDSAVGRTAEIVYLGVVPHFRGRGFGRCLLRHAGADAHARGLEAVELAVDDHNVYATALYESEGYRVTRRQWAYVMFAPRPKSAQPV